MTNSNTWRDFEKLSGEVISKELGVELTYNKPLIIGSAKKEHKFDFVSVDGGIVVECKANKWNRMPAAKISALNETLFFLSFLPESTRKILAMKKEPRNEASGPDSFAGYYCQHFSSLFRDVELWEIDLDGSVEILNHIEAD